MVRLSAPPTGATHRAAPVATAQSPLAPRLAPRSTPPGCSPSSTAEPHARRGSSPSDSAVPAPQVRFSRKTRNNRVVSIPSFARPRAPRRDASRCEARVGVGTRLLTRSPSFARVRAETNPHAPTRRVTIDTASRLTRMLASSRISETREMEIPECFQSSRFRCQAPKVAVRVVFTVRQKTDAYFFFSFPKKRPDAHQSATCATTCRTW